MSDGQPEDPGHPPPGARPEPPPGERARHAPITDAQKRLIGFIVVLAATTIAYRLVYATGFQRTAALYVGVPTVLAIGLARLPRSRTATEMILKGSMLAMMIACVAIPEGLLCLLFAAPLVGMIALVVGGPIDWARRRNKREGPTLMALGLPLLLLSMEGLVGSPFASHEVASASVTVAATPGEVAEALATAPEFDDDLPTFLTLGFNRPVAATGGGTEVGDERRIEFSGGSHDDHPLSIFGLVDSDRSGHRSSMHLTVAESRAGRVVFAVDRDDTMLARWADLNRAVVTWQSNGDGTTTVTWRLEYERLLFPTAYFSPLQRYGMGLAAGHLLDAVVVDHVS